MRSAFGAFVLLVFLPLVYGGPAAGTIPPATIPPVSGAAINVRTPAEVAELRQTLRTIIFGTATLGGPQRTETGISDPEWADVPGLTSIDRLTYEMEFGFVSISYLFHAASPNGRLVIYHEAHAKDFIARKTLIARLLAEGYDVAALDMVLDGRNNKPRLCIPAQGCVRFAVHNQFALIQPSDGHALRFLLEPVIATLNGPGASYEHIAMIGLSGGGWATTLAAALDERIDLSFPVAGSLPLNVRTGESMGDWEQMLPGISHLVSYEDLYVMAASNGRRQMQVLNLRDACCFSGDGSAYRDAVNEAASALGGEWSLFVDEQQRAHDIGPAAIERIMLELDK